MLHVSIFCKGHNLFVVDKIAPKELISDLNS